MGANKQNIYKELEFDKFLKMLEVSALPHLKEIAKIIGVSQDTLTVWVKKPEAMAARVKGINKALAAMEKTGAKDWKMWHTKLKMLGLIEESRQEIIYVKRGGKDFPLEEAEENGK